MSQTTQSAAPPLKNSRQWADLTEAARAVANGSVKINDLLRSDPQRLQKYTLSAAGLLVDWSKNLVTDEVRSLLLALAQRSGMTDAIAAMFRGDIINNTEQRPALHVALRSQDKDSPYEQEVHRILSKMATFVGAVGSGEWTGFNGKAIHDVVNIGIGGSDLGPAMVYEALAPFHLPQLRCHFVSNVDPVHLEQTLEQLDPATTLFVIASKTFTTMETHLNATSARQWLLDAGVPATGLARHFVAVSANVEKAVAFGIDPDNIFPMWNWVGGRYSLWSAIGLPIALGTGMSNFRALLQGAHAMDEHFRTAPLEANMPVILALLNLWYCNFCKAETQVILPYAQNLHLFPAFLQQLDMESLGKHVHKDGSMVSIATGAIVWGSAGTNGQHSFHQLLHQGTHLIPADFIAIAHSASSNIEQHQQLLANCFAQSQALMDGKSLEQATAELQAQGMDSAAAGELAPHKVIPGNRPSNTLLLKELRPATLGALIALYEQKVYAHSVLLQINAFDQWGVELGKVLSTGVYKAIIASEACTSFDASTNALVNLVRS